MALSGEAGVGRASERADAAAGIVLLENATARIGGLRASLSVLAVIALIALFFSRRIPTRSAAGSRPGSPQQLLRASPDLARGRRRTAVHAGRLPRMAACVTTTLRELTAREAWPALYLAEPP